MNTIVICNPYVQDIFSEGIFYKYNMDGEEFTIALLDLPEPDFSDYFNSHSVIIKVLAFSCNYRDRSLMHVFNKECKELSGNRKYFYSPIGSEFVGEVVKIGDKVTSFNIGDRVIADNSYPLKTDGLFGGIPSNFASQRLLLLSDSSLIKVPDCMSNEIAAAFSLSAQTSYSMVRKANIQKGDNVLVNAITSNTSLAILERLKQYNINVFGCSSKAFSLKKSAKELGLKDIFLFDNNYIDFKTNESLKFDIVFDPFIDLYLDKLYPYLNYNSRYVFCGFYNQHVLYEKMNVSIDPSSIFKSCIFLNLSLIGNCIGCNVDLKEALQNFCDGTYIVHIDSVYTGRQVMDFFNRTFLENRMGKVVYKYND